MRSSRLRATVAAVAVSTIVVASAITATGPAFAVPVDNIASFAATGSVQTWVVPAGVTEIGVEVAGAQGGHAYGGGGVGARLAGTVTVTPGSTINIVVGGVGANGAQYQAGSGGGGGSFVYTTATQTGLLAAAGGGGGAGSNSFPTSASVGPSGANGANGGGVGGNAGTGGGGSLVGSYSYTGGGGGLLTDGGNTHGGTSLVGGAAAGNGARFGGFGGGGGTNGSAGGGGGGYSGGGAGNFGQNGEAGGGGGGGSYFSGTLAEAVVDQPGNGFVTITYPSVIASVSASAGKAGDSLTLSGAGLAGATATIGGVAATVTSSSDRKLVVSVPSRSPIPEEAQDIIVTTVGGTVLTAPSAFTYAPIPTVIALSPSTGLVYGGEIIEITGTGFGGMQGVYFGDEFASFIESSGTTISVTVPASVVGTVDVTVVTLGGVSATSAASRYVYAAPTITLTPSTLPAAKQGAAYSQALTASGAQGGAYSFAVTGGSVPAGLTLSADGTISGTPTVSGSVTAIVTATSADSYSGSAGYTIAVASSAPTISSVAPVSGIAGDAVVITGTDLSGATVTIGGEAAPVDSSATNTDTSLTVLVPAVSAAATGAAVSLTVTNAWGSDTESDAFTYIPPTVAGVSPSTGSVYGGTSVALTGTGFTGATAVKFGAANATSFTVNSDTSITAVSPDGEVGSVVITVRTPSGVTSEIAASQFQFSAPTISITPLTLPDGKQGTAYSQVLTADGAQSGPYEFEVAGGELPNGVTLSTDGTLAGTPTENGEFDFVITATSPDGYADDWGFSLDVASSVPTIVGISPETGNAGGAVTITGTDLDGASVTFGGENAPIDASATNTDTSLTVLVPTALAGSEGKSVDVQVTNQWGDATAASAFTYNASTLELKVQFKVGDLAKGAKVAFVASGFAAAQSVTGVVHSTPTTIYSAFTGAGGTLDATVTLPAVEKGSHKLVITAGAESQTVWFAVDAASKITAISMTGPVGNPADIIALTGAEMGPALFGAMGLLVAGLLASALALGGRRRREV